MCHCLQRNFFLFWKIWVGRTTLNREKKGMALSTNSTAEVQAAHFPGRVTCDSILLNVRS